MRITAIRAAAAAAATRPTLRRRRGTLILGASSTRRSSASKPSRGPDGIGSGDTMAGFEDFEHLFIGRDPLLLSGHARTLETIAFHAGRYWPVEAALWDLFGKKLGVPVYSLLGGAGRPAAGLRLARRAARACAACPGRSRARRRRFSRGQAAHCPRRARRGDSPRRPRSATRSGRRSEIIVDLNQWWRMAGDIEPGLGPSDAARVIAQLDELGVLWVEEPLAGADLEGTRGLRSRVRARIAGGEMARTFDELWNALAVDALDVFQPDVVLFAGRLGRAHAGGCRAAAQPLRSRPTRGPTGSACSPTCTSAAASAAAVSPSSRTTRRAADSGTARLHARVAADDRLRWLPRRYRRRPRSGIALDEQAVAHHAV